MIEHMRALEDEARPPGCEKLSAQKRYRVHTVDFVKIDRRREIYKR